MTPADWQAFAEMTGGASGALTGLLFVAVSLNASRIAGHQGLRASAAQTLVLFIAPLVMSAALLAPGQPDGVLGAELIVIGLVTSWILLSLRRVKHTLNDDDQLLIAIFNRRAVNVVVMLLFTASGALLACDESAGLYLLLPVTVIAFISGVLNAWYFLLPPLRPAPSAHAHPGPSGHPQPAASAGRPDAAAHPARQADQAAPAGHPTRQADHPDHPGPTGPAGHAWRTDHPGPTGHTAPASHTEGG